jgi:hypothetical protein
MGSSKLLSNYPSCALVISLDSSGVATLTPNLTNGVNYNIVAVYSCL